MKKWKESRAAGFVIVALVYLLAAVAGVALYRALHLAWWLRLLIADAAATVVVFVFSVLFGNASVYDPYWSVQPIVISLLFALGREMTLQRVLLLIAVCVWGLRLSANWAYTFHGLQYQDWRYTMLHEKTGRGYPFVNFTGIHMVPTLIVYACTLPVVYSLLHDAPWNAGSLLFFCLSLAAVCLQGTADCQMHAFRRAGKGGFLRRGLWKYARHPNYLGEILMWWGIALSVISVFPRAWYLAAGALANTLLFLLVSIPMADGKQARKPGFADYKRETRMLFPIKKRCR